MEYVFTDRFPKPEWLEEHAENKGFRYIKKPVEIEAYHYGVDEIKPDWFIAACNEGVVVYHEEFLSINTLEGIMVGHKNDYIIKGIKGELYPCKPDIFEESYERVE